MTEHALFFHNPRCSKSREALAALQARGIFIEVIEYLKSPPTRDVLERIYDGLGKDVTALIRTKEQEYMQTSLANGHSREAVINALLTYPQLMERPLVLLGNKAAIGRPLTRILELF
jgi:arsenate reductase (glutaredoxin)